MVLPTDGQTGWGDVLNADITALQAEANTTATGLTNHASNSPADPHGDRAYAQSLVNPIVNGVNQANGFVQLNSSGLIPAGLISGGAGSNETGGMYNAVFDAVATFGAVANNGSDQSSAIQSALNAAGSAGGGLVWLGPGTYSLANYLVMPSYTWLLMSEGTILSRIPGSPNPKYIISNVQFGTANTPSTNIKITGGQLNAVGNNAMTSSCTPIFVIQSSKTLIEDVYFYNVFSNPAIEINGCSNALIENCSFDGTGSNNIFGSGSSTPAVRINVSTSGNTPSGLGSFVYSNATCYNVRVINSNTVPTSYGYGCYGALIGSDKTSSSYHSDHVFCMGSSTSYSDNLGTGFYSNSQWTYSVNSGNLFFESNP
jgi:polygalacturonase